MTPSSRPEVIVIGAGITGLAAAWELTGGADGTPEGHGPIVTVLDAADATGGKLRTAAFADREVDLGADTFLARRPEATDLCRDLGISDQLVAMGSSGASILARGRLRAMPEGLHLGVPTRWWPLALSGLLSPRQSVRAARGLVSPHRHPEPVFGDRSVAALVGDRLGAAVVERLADPLIGGIHAGRVEDLSAAAVFPLLIAASSQPGSLMRRLRAAGARSKGAQPPGAVAGPVFWSLRQGVGSLAFQLAAALRSRGVAIRTGVPVTGLGRVDGRDRWSVYLDSSSANRPGLTEPLAAEGLVVATPAGETGRLLAPHAPVAAELLDSIEYASVAVVTVTVPAASIGRPLRGTGYLVPRTTSIDGRTSLVTGVSYLARKWPHLAREGEELIRMSVGRAGDERGRGLDDDELAASAFGELAHVLDIRGGPTDSMVTRWDDAFPQYQVGHLIRVARIEEAVSALPSLAVAGAAFGGIGIPACIGSGRRAAREVLRSLGVDRPPVVGG